VRTRHVRARAKRRAWTPHRRLEAWLWTGPLGHLVGGALDVAQALGAYKLRVRRERRT
jgi:hypothetical protein